jgi:hypothetical protein
LVVRAGLKSVRAGLAGGPSMARQRMLSRR